uniref:Uncharacterized protein n=1 Tax=Kalanchoe fedtschenkoi TaxID=63787 RepID=A0A7N0THK6_KALFE
MSASKRQIKEPRRRSKNQNGVASSLLPSLILSNSLLPKFSSQALLRFSPNSEILTMARVLSQALITRATHSSPLGNRPLVSLKHRHTVAEGTLIEIDLESSTETGESAAVRIVRLEDIMHTIIAQRSAPSWLPFIPGSSYWVPPKPSPKNVASLLKKCSISPALSAEEALSLTTVRGWPSSDHLLGGNKLRSPSEVKLKDTEVQVKVVEIKSKDSDDEED